MLRGVELEGDLVLLHDDVRESTSFEQTAEGGRGGPGEGAGVPAGGGGTSSRSIVVLIGIERNGTWSGSPHEADRDPRARLQETSDALCGGLGVGLEDDPPARDGGVEALHAGNRDWRRPIP